MSGVAPRRELQRSSRRHREANGSIRMADVSAKPLTPRSAVAQCALTMLPRTLATIKAGKLPKGDVWAAAHVAGILASKRTADLIPLCHPIPISHVALRHRFQGDGLTIEAEVATTAPTGPEMEALSAVAMAALTVYDMCKGVERGIVIRRLCLMSKSGGKSGAWKRRENP
jgi:cyclic pyranopterin monophosphate synthase